MPPALIAAIPAIMAVVGEGVQIMQSTGGPHNTAPEPTIPKTSTQIPTTGLTSSTDPAAAAAISARLSQLQNQAGPGGFAPEFYTSTLNAAYPGFDQMVSQIVSQRTGG
jgi:hypothetical protein